MRVTVLPLQNLLQTCNIKSREHSLPSLCYATVIMVTETVKSEWTDYIKNGKFTQRNAIVSMRHLYK